jgi:hypothetical protein
VNVDVIVIGNVIDTVDVAALGNGNDTVSVIDHA